MVNDRWTVAEGVWLDDAVANNAHAATFETELLAVLRGWLR